MAHEPSCFERHAKRAVQLVAADPFLAGAQEVGRLEPQMQRDVARLKYRSDANRELLATSLLRRVRRRSRSKFEQRFSIRKQRLTRKNGHP